MSYPPKKSTEYIFYVGLKSQANGNVLQNAPTLAGGDVKISVEGGSFVNLTNLPIVTPPAGKAVQVTLTADEMDGDEIVVLFSDVAGNEWCDLMIPIYPSNRTIDELTYPGYQLPDSTPADGVIPTLEQSLLLAFRFLFHRTVLGSTMTVFKEDGTTPIMTFTLNNPTVPTAITRTT